MPSGMTRELRAEQEAIDRLVEAVHEGDADGKSTWATRLLEGMADREWRRRRVADSGFINLPRKEPGPNDDLFEVLGVLECAGVSERRLRQIEKGKPLTKRELEIWSRPNQGFNPDGDPSGQNEFVVLEFVHSRDHRHAYVAVVDWRSNSGTFVAAYPSCTDALSRLRSLGEVQITSNRAFAEQFGYFED